MKNDYNNLKMNTSDRKRAIAARAKRLKPLSLTRLFE